MSAPTGSKQVTLDGDRATKWYLTQVPPNDNVEPAEKEREAYCRRCHNRLTESVERSGEWGHDEDCKFHIAGLPETESTRDPTAYRPENEQTLTEAGGQ